MVETGYEEISIKEILDFFRKGWLSILGGSAIGIFAAAALIWTAQERYELTVKLLPPLEGQVAGANLGRIPMSGLQHVQPDEVFQLFVQQLASNEARVRFFQETYLPSLASLPATENEKLHLMAEFLKKNLEVIPPSPKGKDFYQLRMQAMTSEQVVTWLKSYLAQVEASALAIWQKDRRAVLEVAIQNTKQELIAREGLAKKISEDRAVRLSEALEVASAAGVNTPEVTFGKLPAQEGLASFADGSRLYARGVKSLQAELDVLTKREFERPFMDGVREVEARLSLLHVHSAQAHPLPMFRLDGDIYSPLAPTSPKRALITLLGLLLGAGFGCLFAFWKKWCKVAEMRKNEGTSA